MVSLPLNSLRRQSAKVPRRRVEHPAKKTPGGAGTHTGQARDTRAHTGTRITQTNLTTIQTQRHTRTTWHATAETAAGSTAAARRPGADRSPRPTQKRPPPANPQGEPDPASTRSQRPELSAPARRASAPRSWGTTNDARSAERGDERRGRPSDARSAERGGAFLAPRCRPWLRVRRRRQASATDAGLTSSSSVDLPLHLPQSPPTLSLLDAGRSRADFLFVVRVALIGLLIGRDRPSTSHLLLIQGHVGQPPMTCRL